MTPGPILPGAAAGATPEPRTTRPADGPQFEDALRAAHPADGAGRPAPHGPARAAGREPAGPGRHRSDAAAPAAAADAPPPAALAAQAALAAAAHAPAPRPSASPRASTPDRRRAGLAPAIAGPEAPSPGASPEADAPRRAAHRAASAQGPQNGPGQPFVLGVRPATTPARAAVRRAPGAAPLAPAAGAAAGPPVHAAVAARLPDAETGLPPARAAGGGRRRAPAAPTARDALHRAAGAPEATGAGPMAGAAAASRAAEPGPAAGAEAPRAPLPPLPPEPAEPAVTGALLPAAAHLRVRSDALGDLALHLRIADGAAHVRVETAAAAALEARAPELARALAAEGLGLARLEVEPRGAVPAAPPAGPGDPRSATAGGGGDRPGGRDREPPAAPFPPHSSAPARAAPARRSAHDVTA
ncbi:flagellar hook-length control protein FliK [Anaeromyxobacter dehalogenans]|uniref:Flagellar hook-length control protein-like C-terminal domain-containing protein n=1 Tax=Anaeromyxobacter dehalogenans (strain 2CP-C) TaxID=290397 RepID=Q2IQT0_ANADE|nr:flagellar hook-length control protein FliK [Anaeromyxobacter dehalogenans]ABC81163.1 conserved hypothetical protein [Anaeromyxobacter dehalogenans 2CP-C]